MASIKGSDTKSTSSSSVSHPATGSSSFVATENVELNYKAALDQVAPNGWVYIDGFLCCGKSWNIVDIYGPVNIHENITLENEPTLSYRGIAGAVESKYLFDLTLAQIDNGKLSVLVTSETDQCAGIPGSEKTKVKTTDMCRTIFEVIKEAVTSTNSVQGIREGRLTIFQKDWEKVGFLVTIKLQDEDILAVFPENCSISFLFKRTGQNAQPCADYIYKPWYNPFPNLQVHNVEQIAIHVAFDYQCKEHVLFFNSKFVEALGMTPTYRSNPCIVPDGENYVYNNLEPNEHNVIALQQYTKLFHKVLCNEHGFFEKPFIAHTIMRAYWYSVHQKANMHQEVPQVEKILGQHLEEMYHRLRNSVSKDNQISTRCELVWSKTTFTGSPSYAAIENEAVGNCQAFMRQTGCVVPSSFTIFRKEELCEYIENMLETFFSTLFQGIDALRRSINYPQFHQRKLNEQDFKNMYVSEAMIRQLVQGDLEEFSESLKGFLQPVKKPDGTLQKWPFDKKYMTKDENGFLVANPGFIYLMF